MQVYEQVEPQQLFMTRSMTAE